MATEKQIEANKRNAALSTGPSEPGKLRTRFNATKHGMAGESSVVEPGALSEFEDRRAKWAAEFDPAGEAGNWALDQAVASSIRIEKCGRTLDGLTKAERTRARLAWGQDRSVEAATIAARLAQDPVLVSRQLETTLEGVRLLIGAWFGLVEAFEAGRDWSEIEASMALDLLGVSPDFRNGRTPIQAPEGVAPIAFRKAVVLDELDRLEALRDEVMTPLDEMDRELAMDGDLALLSKPAKLVLRYERDAWRRYRESIKKVRDSTEEPAALPVAYRQSRGARSPPSPAKPREASKRNEANFAPSFEEERRSLLEEAKKFLADYPDRTTPIHLVDDDSAWLDKLERHASLPIPAEYAAIAAGVQPSGG